MGNLFKNKKIILITSLSIVGFVLLALSFYLRSNFTKTQKVADNEQTKLYLLPAFANLSPNSNLDIEIKLDTLGKNVTGILAEITYNNTLLTLNSIEKTNSAFGEDNMEVNPNLSSNSLRIVADKPEDNPVNGNNKLVAVLHFTTKGNGNAVVSFSNNSIIETVVNGLSQNLTYQAVSGNYQIGNSSTTITVTQPVTTNTPTLSPTLTATITNGPTTTPTKGPIDFSKCTRHSEGDANCDGKVNKADLDIFLSEYKNPQTTTPNHADFSSGGIGENIVNLFDFAIWRKTCIKGQNGDACK